MAPRPTVSVVVPFAGTPAGFRRLVEVLNGIRLRPGDEVIVADNSTRPAGHGGGIVHVCRAVGVGAPGFARNRGAAIAHGEWLVFIDADTEPSPSLLDDYFEAPPRTRTAVLGGGIADIAGRETLTARHGVERGRMADALTLDRVSGAYAQSANCAVRRAAFEQVGGFDERARAGEDADLCFRLERAGWELERRPRAGVRHRSRATLPALVAQLSMHGAGAAWLNRRYPGSFPPPSARTLATRVVRDVIAALRAARRGDRDAAGFALIDVVAALAFEVGRLRSNQP